MCNEPGDRKISRTVSGRFACQSAVCVRHPSHGRAKIKEFAREFDPQPFHLDEAAAKVSIFGGLAASGWHTAAISMRLLVDGGLPLGNGIIGLGGDLAWPKPTRPGDTLHVESEILEIMPSRSKPNQAIVKVRSITLNQNGEAVHSFTSKCLVFKRPQPA